MANLIDILRQAGFSGTGLQTAYAVAMAESGGNARAFNGNAATGDKSYGLFQINMLGAMGPERLKAYGLSSNDDLYDAVRNAQVAYKMSKGGMDWSPWSTYKNNAYQKYLGQSGAQISSVGGPKTGAQGQQQYQQAVDFLSAADAPQGLAGEYTSPFQTANGDPFASPTKTPTVARGNANSTSYRDKVITTAMQKIGSPYVYGATGTSSFDCSSLMQYAFGANGFNLPRVSYDQLSRGVRTDVRSLRPGDLVGWGDGHHVAMYLGGGRVLEAPHTGAVVRVRALGSGEDVWGVHLSLPGD